MRCGDRGRGDGPGASRLERVDRLRVVLYGGGDTLGHGLARSDYGTPNFKFQGRARSGAATAHSATLAPAASSSVVGEREARRSRPAAASARGDGERGRQPARELQRRGGRREDQRDEQQAARGPGAAATVATAEQREQRRLPARARRRARARPSRSNAVSASGRWRGGERDGDGRARAGRGGEQVARSVMPEQVAEQQLLEPRRRVGREREQRAEPEQRRRPRRPRRGRRRCARRARRARSRPPRRARRRPRRGSAARRRARRSRARAACAWRSDSAA